MDCRVLLNLSTNAACDKESGLSNLIPLYKQNYVNISLVISVPVSIIRCIGLPPASSRTDLNAFRTVGPLLFSKWPILFVRDEDWTLMELKNELLSLVLNIFFS